MQLRTSKSSCLSTLMNGSTLCLALWATPMPAGAQSACSSDGVAAPTRLQERFISADCETCWGATDTPPWDKRTLVLDWLVPGSLGDEAPLSAAATRDALTRLAALQLPSPGAHGTVQRHSQVRPSLHRPRLRVAMGPLLNGYVGVSLETRGLAGTGPWPVWMMLVERVAAGTEGSPVDRNVVRNLYFGNIDKALLLSKKEHLTGLRSFVMQVPEGARAERLGLVAGVGNTAGQWLALAQTLCPAAETR